MPSSPRWLWNSEFSYYPSWFKNFRTSVEWQHVAGYFQNQVNTVRYEGYNVLNFRVGYHYKSVEIFSNILNLTDVLYATNATRGNNATDRTTYTLRLHELLSWVFSITSTVKDNLHGK